MIRPHQSPLKSSRMHRRRRLGVILKTGGVLVALAAVGWGVSWLSYRPFLTIAAVQVQGTVSVSAPSVQALASRDINGAYGWLVAKSNQFLYPRKSISGDIEKTFPQVAAVQLAVSDHVLTVNVTERQPAYRWCPAASFAPTFPDPASSVLGNDQCYFMDDLGYIFMAVPIDATEVTLGDASSTASTAFFRFYGRVASTSAPIGAAYMLAAQFTKLTQLVAILANERHLPSYAFIDRPDGVAELFLTQGGAIVFDDDQDTSEVLTDVAALQASTPIFGYGPKLGYVDIRLGNKAFYKLVDKTASSTAAQ